MGFTTFSKMGTWESEGFLEEVAMGCVWGSMHTQVGAAEMAGDLLRRIVRVSRRKSHDPL